MKKICVYICLFHTLQVVSQVPAWQVVELSEDHNIEALEVDTLGFLWALCSDGLYKYDGYAFLKKNITQGNRSLTSLFLSANLFYIGTNQGELYEFDPMTDEHFLVDTLPEAIPINDINVLSNGVFALSSYSNGLFLSQENEHLHLERESGLVSDEIYSLNNFHNKLIIGTDQGVQVLNTEGNVETLDILSMGVGDIIVKNVFVDQENIWISNFDTQVCLIRDQQLIKKYNFDTTSKINDLQLVNDDLYVCRDDGLYRINSTGLKKIYPEKGSAKITSVTLDKEQNLWISDAGSGLVKGNLLIQKYSQPCDQIQSLAVVNDLLWIACQDGLFVEGESITKLSNKNSTSIEPVGDYIWVGSFSHGIDVYDRLGNRVFVVDNWTDVTNESILTMQADGNRVYVSSLTGLVIMKQYVDRGGKFSVEVQESISARIGQSYTYDILNEDGKLYLGNDRDGLTRYDISSGASNKMLFFQNGKKIGSVFSLAYDGSGQIWLSASPGGLGYLKEDSLVQLIDLEDPYTSLIPLPENQMLLIGSSSIDVLETKDKYINFSMDMPSGNERMPFLNAFYVTNKGIFFAHGAHIYIYDFNSTFKKYPEVILDQVLVNLEQVAGRHSFRENDNNIQFDFTGTWLKSPEKLTYKYRLVGFDNDWRQTKDRSVAYPQLRPGNYEFQVVASENAHFNYDKAQGYTFSIKRHFYNQRWFQIFCLALLIGLIWKWRNNAVMARETKLALENQNIESKLINLQNQMNPHFLFNSFNTLVGLIEEQDLDRSIKFVEDLSDFYRCILDHSKQEMVSFEAEMELAKKFVTILNQRFENSINLILDDAYSLKSIPPLTLQLLIENVVKHNEIGRTQPMDIFIEEKDDTLHIRNKKKIKSYKMTSTGSGLANIRKRYLLIANKTVQVHESEEWFEVVLPHLHIQ